jgi:hypothetical protein
MGWEGGKAADRVGGWCANCRRGCSPPGQCWSPPLQGPCSEASRWRRTTHRRRSHRGHPSGGGVAESHRSGGSPGGPHLATPADVLAPADSGAGGMGWLHERPWLVNSAKLVKQARVEKRLRREQQPWAVRPKDHCSAPFLDGMSRWTPLPVTKSSVL